MMLERMPCFAEVRKNGFYGFPESRAVIHFTKMRKFVSNHVIDAIELWEETRRLSKAPNLKVRELPNVNWSRLFLHDLGIKLRFPPSRLPQGKKQ